MDFTGHNANLLISTLAIGNQPRSASQNTLFKFDTGTLTASTVQLGFDNNGNAIAAATLSAEMDIGGGVVNLGTVGMGTVTDTSTATRSINATLSISGSGTVTVGSTGAYAIGMGNTTGSGTATSVTDTLNLTGGTLTLLGNLITSTTARTTSVVNLNGGTLDLRGNNIGTAALPISTLTFAGGTLQNVGTINGTGGMVKTTTGTLTLAGNNAWTGDTQINGGVLAASAASNLGGGALDFNNSGNGSTLRFLGGFDPTMTASGTRNVNIYSGGGTFDLNGQAILVAGALGMTGSGALGSLTVTDGSGGTPGTLTLTGSNIYQGGTTISNGATVQIATDNASGAAPFGAVPGSATPGSIVLNGGALSANGSFTLSPSRGIALGPASGTGSGTINVTGTNQLTYAGQINNNGSTDSLVKTGSGTLYLTGSNAYSGATAVQAGTLSVNAVATGTSPQPLGESQGAGAVTLGVSGVSSGTLLYTGNTGTLDKGISALGNGNDTIQNTGSGLLTLTGSITKNGTVLTLKPGANGIAVSGVIVGPNPGSDLYVSGTGNVTLNSSNTYNGPTTVNNGATLTLGATNAIPTTTGALTLNSGTLNLGSFTQTVSAMTVTTNGGGVQILGSTSGAPLTVSGALTLTGALTINAAGTFNVSPTQGVYRFLGYGLESGAGISSVTVTNAPSYSLVNGTINSNEYDLQHNATLGAGLILGSSTNARPGATVSVSGTFNNAAPAGSATANLTIGSTGTLPAGSITPSSTQVAVGATPTVTATVAAPSAGGSATWQITGSDSGPGLASASFGGTVVAYDYAHPTYPNSTTVGFGNVHVGGTQSLTVGNAWVSSTPGYQDSLAVSADNGGNSLLSVLNPAGAIVASGSGNVVYTAAGAGNLAATGILTLTSSCNGISGLSDSTLSAGSFTITGTAYDYAQPSYSNAVNLGNVRVGATGTLQVTNSVRSNASYQDSLAVSSNNGGNALLSVLNPAGAIVASGSGNVVYTAAGAGNLGATGTLTLTSSCNGISGLSDTPLFAGSVSITGTAYDYAQPTYPNATTVNFGNVRVGTAGTLQVTNSVRSNASYQDSLVVSADNGGNSLLSVLNPPGAIVANSSGNVAYTAIGAGNLGATGTLTLTSSCNGISGLSDSTLSAGSFTITGTAYDYAQPSYSNAVNLGNVRVGATGTLQVTNSVRSNPSYQDSLVVSSNNGNNSLLSVLNPAGAIVASGSGNVVYTAMGAGDLGAAGILTLTSSCNGISGLSDTSLSPGSFTVTGTAYDYAQAQYTGTTLAFGNLHQTGTSNVVSRSVAFSNPQVTNASYQDSLDVSASTGNSLVTPSGFTGLAASGNGTTTTNNLTFSVNTVSAGSLVSTATLTLNSNHNNVGGLQDGTPTVVGSPGAISTTGQVYSGQSVWSTNGSGTWGVTTTSADFGQYWGQNQGSPGLDPGFTTTDTATFDNTKLSVGASATVALNGANPSLKAMNFNTTGGGGYTISNSGGGTLTLASSGGPAAINVASGTHAISAPIAAAGNLNVTTTGQLTISGPIGKSGTTAVALAKYGSGTLILGGSNSYDAGTTIAAGTLSVSSSGNLPTAGGLAFAAGGSGALQITGSGTFASSVSISLLGDGTFKLDNTADSGTLLGNITGIGGLTKSGSGTLTLTGTNGYLGLTLVNGGTLVAGGVTSLPLGGAFDVGASGTLVLLGGDLPPALTGDAQSAAMAMVAGPQSAGAIASPQSIAAMALPAAGDPPAPGGGSFNPSSVPEPGTLALLAAGAAGLLVMALRRRKRA